MRHRDAHSAFAGRSKGSNEPTIREKSANDPTAWVCVKAARMQPVGVRGQQIVTEPCMELLAVPMARQIDVEASRTSAFERSLGLGLGVAVRAWSAIPDIQCWDEPVLLRSIALLPRFDF